MKKHGNGIGSTPILLIFTVLCLAIFAVLSLTTALADKAMADAAACSVKGYYEADTLAECILSEILKEDKIPDAIMGINITANAESGTVAFICPISEKKCLYVEAAVYEGDYNILKWRTQDVGEWETDKGMPVWPGD